MGINLTDIGLQLLGSSSDGVIAFDQAQCCTFWNQPLERLFGLREDEVRGQLLSDAFPLYASLEHVCARALAGELVRIDTTEFQIRETGCSGFIEGQGSPLRGPDGKIVGGLLLIRDVTERKRTEAEMREVETRFGRMADSSPVLLWMAGLDGECNFFNQTWLRFTGRTLEQELGVGWAEGVHPFDFQHCVDTYIAHFNKRAPFEMEYRLRRADGEYRWILDRGAPRYNPDGSFAGFIGSCTDITELKSAQLGLKQALSKAEELSRLKSEFLANISHELRTPLNAIVNIPLATLREFPSISVWECHRCGQAFEPVVGESDTAPAKEAEAALCPSCEGMLRVKERPYYVGEPSKTAHFLERLVQSSQHLLKVVNDLLDFSKLDAGRVQLAPSTFEVSEVLFEVQQTVAALIEEKGLSLRMPAPGRGLRIHADRLKLSQILLNLLSNAMKFTDSGGEIEVHAGIESRSGVPWFVCSIKDTGIGIPRDKFSIIFESFRQADGSHTRTHQGTGLGLSIVKKLIDLHGGEISVESQVGAGSTFTFALPQPLIEDLSRPTNGARPAATGRVLVVEDNPVDLELARASLEREGLSVHGVSRADMALSAVLEFAPHCIVLDVMMPHMNGLTILRHLKNDPQTRGIPVLVSTAYHSNREIVRSLGGVWHPKPWNAADLVTSVRAYIEHYIESARP